MQRTMMMLLLAVRLPEGDPLREQALSVLAPRLAQQFQAQLAAEDEAARLRRLATGASK